MEIDQWQVAGFALHSGSLSPVQGCSCSFSLVGSLSAIGACGGGRTISALLAIAEKLEAQNRERNRMNFMNQY